ncbi:hypothetical protein quinque_015713 [Culex quinquefasciatus]
MEKHLDVVEISDDEDQCSVVVISEEEEQCEVEEITDHNNPYMLMSTYVALHRNLAFLSNHDCETYPPGLLLPNPVVDTNRPSEDSSGS